MRDIPIWSGMLTTNSPWQLFGNACRYLLASLVLFFGLSAANAFGGWLQVGFYGWCLVVALSKKHRVPTSNIALAFGCGLLALVASLRAEPSVEPFFKFIRPFVEGYLLAIIMYWSCRIRTFQSLMMVLAGYVLIEFISFSIMVSMPEIRSELLELWYVDDSYQREAFQKALIFRGYGISRHHLFGLPLAMGTVSAMLLVAGSFGLSIKLRAYFILAAFSGLMVVLLNARIGFIPVVLCYLLGISIFFNRYYLKHLVVLVLIFLPAIYLLNKFYFGEALDLVSEWLLEGVRQFFDTSAAADATTMSDLGEMVILPTTWDSWLIGDGRICDPGESCYTDIGWLRLIQEGGFVLLAIVTVMYLQSILHACRWLSFVGVTNCNSSLVSTRHLFFWTLIGTFVAATIKGDSFGANEYSRLIMMLGVLSRLAGPKSSPYTANPDKRLP